MKKVPLVPRNRRGRVFERVGLKIREFAGVSIEEPLDPFELARFFKIRVIEPSDIRRLPRNVLAELTRRSRSKWSAVTIGLSDHWQLCILNPTHNHERTRATLMEEIAHVLLGHEPTRIVTAPGGVGFREYNRINEQAAYGVGAAALVPYAPLFVGLMDGQTPEKIAKRCEVSPELVIYRIKITMLWRLYRSKCS